MKSSTRGAARLVEMYKNQKGDEMKEESFEYTEWWKSGGMLMRRSCLNFDHPQSIPSLWISKYGSLEGFPFDEVYGPDQTIEKSVAMAAAVPTSILKSELNKRLTRGEE